ncbi:MAG TPA: UdgX family uracil-DNA binding protein [Steroidobacteraceae bacterium]|nr:UdgX family uracil-DNA binding protein [Steroidobacteraceae bacterium]
MADKVVADKDEDFPTPSHTAAELIPSAVTLPTLRERAAECIACPLHRHATQTVFGEGPTSAALMLVGEVPGDQEDRLGHPFVGPAGQILQHCLAEAGLERENVYITNVVKHFKFERRGKVRLHKKPNSAEIHACQPWLDREIALVKPRVLVCLGSTAAQALLGAEFRVTRMRGKWIESRLAPKVMATVHPSSILRGPREERERETLRLIADLKLAARGLD